MIQRYNSRNKRVTPRINLNRKFLAFCNWSFIKEKHFTAANFNWQEGFGAFSYSQSHLNTVINYIENQKQHHKKKTFKDEYIALLKAFEIEYNEEYTFEWFDENELD